MKRLLIITCLLFGDLAAAQSIHSGKLYNIEILVFQNLAPSDNGESWPLQSSVWADEEDEEAVSSGVEFNETKPVHWLKGSNLKLDKQIGAIARSSGYRKLAVYAWRQAVLDRNLATPMKLPASTPTKTGAYVDGSVITSVGRYLHLNLDLVLHDQQTGDDYQLQDFEQPEFRLTEQRRMRSKELHYFDHPRFGVLAIITPYEEPVSVAEPEPAAENQP